MRSALSCTIAILIFLASSFPVSAQVIFPNRGGTGSTQVPSYGQVLVGTANGTYVPTATSSLGISAGSSSGFSTTSANFWSSLGYGWSTTSANHFLNSTSTYSTTSADAWLTTKSTSNLSEGANFYYTNARVQTYLDTLLKGYFFSTTSANAWSALGYGWSTTSANAFLNATSTFSTTSANAWLTTKSTSNLTEGSNLYFTDARVRTYLDSLIKGYFFSTTSANYWASQGLAWSTTSASHFLSQNQGAAFSTTSASFWSSLGYGWSTTSANAFLNATSTFATSSSNFWLNSSSTQSLPGCATNSVIKWSGSRWNCGTDDTASAGTGFSTTSADFWSSLGYGHSTTSSNAWLATVTSTSTAVCAFGCPYSSIQTALNAGWTDIYVRDGVYSEQITVQNSKTVIRGESLNAVIQCNGSSQSPCVSTNAKDEFTIQNLTIRETNAVLLGIGIDFSNSALGLISGVRLNNFATSTFASDTANNTFYNRLENNTFFNPHTCIDLGGSQPNAHKSEGNRCRPMAVNGAIGLHLGNVRGFTSVSDDFESTTTAVTSIGIFTSSTSREVSFTNPWVEANGTGVFIESGANRITFNGGSITSNGTDITDNGSNTVFLNTSDTGVLVTKLGNATTSGLAISNVLSSLLKTDSSGNVIPAVLGTDYIASVGFGKTWEITSGDLAPTTTLDVRLPANLVAPNGTLVLDPASRFLYDTTEVQSVDFDGRLLTDTSGSGNSIDWGGRTLLAASTNTALDWSDETALILSGYDCSGNTNGGTLTVDASGNLICADDDTGGGGSLFGQAWEIANGALAPTTTVGIQVSASSTIGDATQQGGLTISGGATTSLNHYIAGSTGIGAQPQVDRSLYVYRNASSEYAAEIFNDQVTAGNGLRVRSDGTGTGTSIFTVTTGTFANIFTSYGNMNFAENLSVGATSVPPNDGLFVSGATGIGTNNPTAKLSVVGSLSVSGTTTISASTTIGDGTNGLTIFGNATTSQATTTDLAVTNLTASRAVFTNGTKGLTTTGTVGAIEAAVGSQNIILETEFDACSELIALIDDETGTCGSLVFSNNPTIAGIIGTGLLDFGGATLEIPNGTNPTADDPGEIAHDTTDNQLILDDFVVAKAVNTIWSATIASTSPALIDGGLLKVPTQLDGYTVTAIRCSVQSGTSQVIAVEDEAGNSSEDITCGTSVTSDDGSITNATYTATEEAYIDFGATSGAVDYVSISVFGTWTRE